VFVTEGRSTSILDGPLWTWEEEAFKEGSVILEVDTLTRVGSGNFLAKHLSYSFSALSCAYANGPQIEPIWEGYCLESQSVSLGALAFDWGLGERGWVGETIVAILAKAMVLEAWYLLLLTDLEELSAWCALSLCFPWPYFFFCCWEESLCDCCLSWGFFFQEEGWSPLGTPEWWAIWALVNLWENSD